MKLYKNSRGATLVEYSLILSLVLLIALPSVSFMGIEVEEVFCGLMRDRPDGTPSPFVNDGEGEVNPDGPCQFMSPGATGSDDGGGFSF